VAASFQQPTRVDYYDYQQRTQRMGPQTMMGAAPTSVAPYQQRGYQPGYNDGGYDGGDSGQQRGGSRRWVPWLIGGIVALAAIIVTVILLSSSNSSGGAFVPAALKGETQAQAVSQITAAGLKANVVKQTSSTVAKGLVISTSPDSGAAISKGGTVTVNVSLGVGTILLPDFQGQQATSYATQLKNLGFTNVQQMQDAQSTLPSGQVDHITPAANQKYAPDQQIILYVSQGGIKVPPVTGLPVNSAIQLLKNDGFTATPSVSYIVGAAGTTPGIVWSQTPDQGTTVPANTQITLSVQPNATSSPSASASASASASSSATPTGTPTSTATATPTPSDTTTTTPPGGGNGVSINP
jgi:serine/threonine-protein kinase